MRLLVTGGSGTLGTELLREARGLGLEATGTFSSRPAPGLVALDVRDAAAVESLLRESRPDCVIHTAYVQADEEAMLAVNVEGSRAVARATRAVGARLVHLSTDLVFDGRKGAEYSEDDALCPATAYGKTKALAEEAVVAEAPEALVVRTSLLYGGAVQTAHERLAFDAAERLVEATFFVDEIRQPTHVGDLARALLALLPDGRCGPVHLVGAHAVSRLELASLLTGADDLAGGPAPPGRPLDVRLRATVALRGVRDVLGAR